MHFFKFKIMINIIIKIIKIIKIIIIYIVFCPVWDSFSSENILCYYIALRTSFLWCPAWNSSCLT